MSEENTVGTEELFLEEELPTGIETLNFIIYPNYFEEGMMGLFVKDENFDAPFLIPIKATEEFGLKLFDKDQYESIKSELQIAVADFGELRGRVEHIAGYPVITSPSDLNLEPIVEKLGMRFRHYCLLVISKNQFISCYVPYSNTLQYFDEWLRRHKEFQMHEKIPKVGVTPKTSCGTNTLH